MSSRRDRDEHFMRRALRLARRGIGRTWPNPAVGAVIVQGDTVVGEGWHRRAGLPHAEAEALANAGSRARGATIYVTLEPCAHQGRTPPCSQALIAAGVARCVIGVKDPHAIVDGRGVRELRAAGVRVQVGVLADEARDVLGGYWHRHALGRPRVTWKVAATLDGRIADAGGCAKWITGPEARRRGHELRAASGAVVIGARTARRDDPRLTARGVGAARQPLRVVCDTRLRLPLDLKLFSRSLAPGTVVACARTAPVAKARALEARGAQVWRLPASGAGVSPRALARKLAALELDDVLIEGGAALGTSWLKAGHVDRIAMFSAPRVLGGGLDWCGPLGRARLDRARSGRIESVEAVGTDALILMRLD